MIFLNIKTNSIKYLQKAFNILKLCKSTVADFITIHKFLILLVLKSSSKSVKNHLQFNLFYGYQFCIFAIQNIRYNYYSKTPLYYGFDPICSPACTFTIFNS